MDLDYLVALSGLHLGDDFAPPLLQLTQSVASQPRLPPSPPVMNSRQRLIPRSTSPRSLERRRLSPCCCLLSLVNSRLNSAANSSSNSWLPRRNPSTRLVLGIPVRGPRCRNRSSGTFLAAG